MYIKVLDKNLNFITLIDDFKTLTIERKYADVEKITITINADKNNTEYLVAGNFVFVDDKLNKFFRIYNTKKALTTKGITITATGYSVMQMFKQRVTIPPAGTDVETYTAKTETIIKNYVNSNCVNSTDTNMNFNIISIGSNHGLGTSITDETRYKNLYDEVIRLTAIDDLGVKSTFNTSTKKLVFDIYKGTDKTAGNTAGNNPIIFGTDFDNLLEATLEYTETKIQNYAIVGGQGEAEARTIQVVSDSKTCLDRHVFFIDARDISTTADLVNRGKSELVLPSYMVNAVINPFAEPKYETDYDIGDLVTVVVDGLELDTRIIEITETYQDNKFDIDVTFGTKSIDLSTVLNRSNRRLANLETK